MIEQESQIVRAGASARSINTMLVAAFTASIFLSAFLLFSVQPMFTKMALPFLGGAPNVWNIALVFFQAVLLGGYIYAHLISRYLPVKTQLIVHITIITAGFLFLPIAIPYGVTPMIEAPNLWLIGLFAAALGMPFFALSANAPLLQRWFSHTSHTKAQDPYFLYAASNLGSLLALISYPLLIEPFLGLAMQSNIWMLFYVVLLSAIGVAGIIALANSGSAGSASSPKTEGHARASWAQRAEWVAIAAIPSALMLGVTSHLSANVAAAPFLWVGPLALYLLTFIIAFSKKPALRPQMMDRLFPIVAVLGLIYTALHFKSFWLVVGVNLIVFFVIALHCHHRLAALRPPVARLTEFYLAMSLGGVIGGAFTALVAPVIFNGVYEYPLLIVASAFIGVTVAPKLRDYGRAIFAVLMILGAFFAVSIGVENIAMAPGAENFLTAILLLVISAALYPLYRRKIVFAAGLGAFAIVLQFAGFLSNSGEHNKTVFNERNFFGVIHVYERESENRKYHLFAHGDTNHNAQLLDGDLRREPLLYFGPQGPFGQMIRALRGPENKPIDVALIGLGAGAMACYVQPDDDWTFFEIDPAVARMARDPELFTYLSDCAPDAPVEIGDARLNLIHKPDGVYDVVIIDAFSSDLIPAHLITSEALALYRSKLKPGGIVFFHTTNRLVDVSSVAIAASRAAGLSAIATDYFPPDDISFRALRSQTSAVIVGDKLNIDEIAKRLPAWSARDPHRYVKPWTDDYSNIVSAIAAHSDGGNRDSD